MSSGIFKDYFGRGLNAALPAAATIIPGAGTSAFYYATDTGKLYALNAAGTAWDYINAGGGGGGSDPLSYGTVDSSAYSTLVGFGTAPTKADNATRGAIVANPASGTDRIYMYLRTMPDVNTTLTSRVNLSGMRGNPSIGLCLRRSTGTQSILHLFTQSSGGFLEYNSSSNDKDIGGGTPNYTPHVIELTLRIVYTALSSTVQFQVSFDQGITFNDLGGVGTTISGFLSGKPDQIGLVVRERSQSAGSIAGGVFKSISDPNIGLDWSRR